MNVKHQVACLCGWMNFTLTGTMYKKYFDSHPLLHLEWDFKFCQSNGYKTVCNCGLDLHFTHDQWNWASLPMFIGHLYVLYCEMSFNFFRPFSSWVVWLSFSYQFVVVLYIFSYSSPPLSMAYTVSRIDSLICFEIRIHWIFPPCSPSWFIEKSIVFPLI